ncbi:hypothetical protein [Microvirga terricola]|uniref:Uncharacterized protein n=1 Tax=Microvirga terricola TaxID=2719797 RepID=A0ABX0V8K4_9HYPH|nr:hypothetical protein [Microvirga terricola]NIX75903.1 hypothetical protein [Microvirga terricola]
MSTKAILTPLLLLVAGPASAECVYKNAYNYVRGEYETVPFSCPSAQANQTPKFRSWHECPVHEERDPASGDIYRIRSCA